MERLLEIIHANDDHMDVGVLGGKVIFHVLSEYGHSDLAYKMITRPDYPSYGNLLELGATTLWERFSTDMSTSRNHHFWGDISAWFIKCLAGIRFNPDGRDITKVHIKPSFVKALDYAEGYYTAPAGKILSSWKRDGDKIILKLEIPDGVTATAYVESGYAFENGLQSMEVTGGEYVIKCI